MDTHGELDFLGSTNLRVVNSRADYIHSLRIYLSRVCSSETASRKDFRASYGARTGYALGACAHHFRRVGFVESHSQPDVYDPGTPTREGLIARGSRLQRRGPPRETLLRLT